MFVIVLDRMVVGIVCCSRSINMNILLFCGIMFSLYLNRIILILIGGNSISLVIVILIVVFKLSLEFFGFIDKVLFSINIMYGIRVVFSMVKLLVNYLSIVLFLNNRVFVLGNIFIKMVIIEVIIGGCIKCWIGVFFVIMWIFFIM